MSPKLFDYNLRAGKTDGFALHVNLAKGPTIAEPLDILFLFDCTGSMSNVIDSVTSHAGEIMAYIRDKISPDSAFGVASFGDYLPDSYPWKLHQDLTSNLAAVHRALADISLQNGEDTPEAYSRALYESQFVGWRPKSRRMVILFGDAPAHDPGFYGHDLGIDPGRDGVPGTSDDLRLAEVVKQLARQQISVLAIYDTSPKELLDEARRGFEFMAQQTGGLAKPIEAATEVAQAIRAGVREKSLPAPIVLPPPGYRSWVDLGAPRKGADGTRHFEFNVTLHPPEGTPDGVYRFPLRAVSGSPDGKEIGTTWVTVRLGIVHWRWPWLWVYLFALLWLLRRTLRGRRIPVRYEQNGQLWVLLWRVGVLLLSLSLIPIIWVYIP